MDVTTYSPEVTQSMESAISDETISQFLIGFFVVYGIIWFIALVCLIVGKVVRMNFAKKCGAKLYGLVWLPIGNEYVEGQIADMYEDKKTRIWYPVTAGIVYFAGILYYLISMISMVGFIPKFESFTEDSAPEEILLVFGQMYAVLFGLLLIIIIPTLVYTVFRYLALNRIMNLKDQKNGTLWFVLTVVFGGLIYFIFQCAKMNKPNVPKYVPKPPAQAQTPVQAPAQALPEQTENAPAEISAAVEDAAETVQAAEETAEAVEAAVETAAE